MSVSDPQVDGRMNDRSSEEPHGDPVAEQRPEECTAVVADGDPRPNVLFTPPCTCSWCAPGPAEFAAERPDRNWLRMSGSRQRLRVENVQLGAAGRALLG